MTPQFQAALDEIRHFLSVIPLSELSPEWAHELTLWLDPAGYWHQPERLPGQVNLVAHELRLKLDFYRQGIVDALPVPVTTDKWLRVDGGYRNAKGDPYVMRSVAGRGTCLLPAILVDEESAEVGT